MSDLGLAVSFGLAILIFTVTLFIERPLDFSAFPTVLLASLMLRLSLNVSSTKLIIGSGHTGPGAAGGVIEGFAMFVMGGSVFLGLVVFLVLLIVNFVVITKGAGRMAEVGARFALDAMPGKQLAIDSDVAAGAITHAQAKERRRIEQEETTFFGSLDGASKFVKGDAIAGLLITLLNIIVGLATGIGVHGMSFSAAIETYAILTVGDGLVSQILSVFTSIAAALLLSKGGVTGSTDRALLDQLGGYPGALGTVAGLMALFAFVPGLPFLPFILGASVLALGATLSVRKAAERAEAALEPVLEVDATGAAPRASIGDLLDVDEIHVRFAPDLIASVLDPAVGLEKRIVNMRRHIASEFGVVMPEVRLTDDPIVAAGYYVIHVQGIEVAKAILRPGHVLVLTRVDMPLNVPGEDVAEPVYGAPARWVPQANQEDAAALGLPAIAPGEVIATHLLETVKANFGRLFTRRALRSLLQEFTRPSDPARADANRKLLDEFVPEKVPHDLLQTVLRLLLEERVSVRNLPLVLEATAEGRAAGLPPEQIVEHVRRRIAFHIVAKLCDKQGKLPLVQLAPRWEVLFAEHEHTDDGRVDIVLPPDEFSRLARAVSESLGTAARQGVYPAIATSARRRRFVRHVLEAKGIQNPVLSFEEIGSHTTLALVGTA
ncbi:MAG TPA: flagellar biosynthesis protein FlhA [Thermohalobaculum sp.]|nr:flagellar biosynthesis protein FlhA [Thermohalobaculum sp.]